MRKSLPTNLFPVHKQLNYVCSLSVVCVCVGAYSEETTVERMRVQLNWLVELKRRAGDGGAVTETEKLFVCFPHR